MTLLIVLCVIVLLALEAFSFRDTLRDLHVRFEADTRLVAPGETLTLRFSVSNAGRWPLLLLGLSIQLDPNAALCEDESWCLRHVTASDVGQRASFHFFLFPHRSFQGQLRLSLQRRGLHNLGRYYLTTGDFFGLRPVIRGCDADFRVVCTSRRIEPPALQAPGGLYGDLSVRRFIVDDPCMLRGYREYSGFEPLKLISWKQSAKSGTLIVRQNDFTADRNTVVFFNVQHTLPAEAKERSLELLRAVCDWMEDRSVPYALYTNGDLFSLPEGVGRSHRFQLHRRIGLSRLTSFRSFFSLIEGYCDGRRPAVSFVVITPRPDEQTQAALDTLRRYGSRSLYVLEV